MKAQDKTTVGRRDFLRAWAPARRSRLRRRRSCRDSAQPTARATTRSARRATKRNRTREDLLPRQQLSGEVREAPVLIKRKNVRHAAARSPPRLRPRPAALDRRTFLRRSGLAAGGLAALGALPLGTVRKAEAGRRRRRGARVTIRKNICTHCSVGCTVMAEVAERRLGRPGAGLGSARSIAARIAPRARRRASWCTATAA